MTLGTQPWSSWSGAPTRLRRAPGSINGTRAADHRRAPLKPSQPIAIAWDQYWIAASVGAVQFTALDPRLSAFPFPDSDTSWFREVVQRAWLPAIYPFWGRQVIHASAAGPAHTTDVIAFTGPTLAGKSTTAYAMGRRPGWRLISDDTLAFTTPPGDGIRLHPIRNDARLRPASAHYFGKTEH